MFQALKLKKKNGIFDVMGKVYKNNIFIFKNSIKATIMPKVRDIVIYDKHYFKIKEVITAITGKSEYDVYALIVKEINQK